MKYTVEIEKEASNRWIAKVSGHKRYEQSGNTRAHAVARVLREVAKEELKGRLEGKQKVSGNILYSSYETLKPGGIYLLGFNPGGDSKECMTLGESICKMPCTTTNEYIDKGWKNDREQNPKAGEATLQKRVRWLLNKLVGDEKKFNEDGEDGRKYQGSLCQ